MSDDSGMRLGHVGLYVTDVPRMVEFYTGVLGFVVTDADDKLNLTFLSRSAQDHHQVVLVAGRAQGIKETVQQISFNVGSLEAVQRIYKQIADSAAYDLNPVTHGIALVECCSATCLSCGALMRPRSLLDVRQSGVLWSGRAGILSKTVKGLWVLCGRPRAHRFGKRDQDRRHHGGRARCRPEGDARPLRPTGDAEMDLHRRHTGWLLRLHSDPAGRDACTPVWPQHLTGRVLY